MIRTCLISWLVVGLLTTAHAQRDTSFYRTTPIPTHLRPIERALGSSSLGSVYYYGGKKLTGAYSLEVPFFELNDPIVNRHYRNFRIWNTVSRLTALVPLVYFIARTRSTGFNSGEYWTIYGGSVALSIGTVIVANTQVNKSVARYNSLLRQNYRVQVGATLTPLPTGLPALGIGVVGKW
ncbi:hypothetical protein [Fibrella aquatilis]|uniref:DUF5683 domain-containing protein n=1 Tax=Fibrella aquatilis TaxID=2817059 RepID=A0A939K301_9BACT|nr:hypothetical protein [Fibrella aquatilis]MBO0934616.1 hypothetical protein [Fibrella aquatilis]